MDEERYEDVIDAYVRGVGVEPGETLTEYIKRNNIKIMDPEPRDEKMGGGIMRKMLRAGSEPDFPDTRDNPINPFDEDLEEDIDIKELMKDQGIPMGEQVKSKKEGIMQMAGDSREEERDLEFLIELEEFLGENPGATVQDFMKIKMLEAKLRKEARDDALARITLAGGSFPDLSKDGEITQEDILIGRGVLPEPKRSGGIAGILGV